MSKIHSKIIITSDFESLKDELLQAYNDCILKFFIFEEFVIANAHEVIAEAYIAEMQRKMIVIMAKSFRIEAQNALLKIIEEPPRNISFLLLVNSKNLLLPTIRSRLVIENRLQIQPKKRVDLNLEQLDLKEIYRFLTECETMQKNDELGKNELKNLISNISLQALELGYKFNQDEMEYFFKLIHLANLNSKPHSVLTPFLLLLLQKARE